MTGLLFTLLAVLLASLGARDQATVAALADPRGSGGGSGGGLLATAIAVSLLSAALAAAAAVAVAPMLTPKARMIFVAMALALAGLESLVFSPRRRPEEPTRSLGAFAIVLFAHQLTDSARFLVFAIAVATAAAIPAGIGGAVGGAVAVTAAWLAPDLLAGDGVRLARRIIGGLLLAGAGIVLL